MLKAVWISGIVLITAIWLANLYEQKTSFTTMPPELPLQWWGEAPEGQQDLSVKSFRVNVSSEVIEDLKIRLNITRTFQPPIEGIGFQYGFNTKFLQTVVDFWKNKYVWKERENFLNSLPQYTTTVAGLRIHFIHMMPPKANGVKVLPLLMIHGWPGSIREFYKVLPMLSTPRPGEKFVFEVIAPSIPGYGFSQATKKPGLGGAQIAVLFNTLMEQLGYQEYYVQGGDWGSLIGQNIAQLYPHKVRGIHTNMCMSLPPLITNIKLLIGNWFPSVVTDKKDDKDKLYPLSKHYGFLLEETGYMHLQATKPDTIGVGLRDSPVGLAAYILEKFSTWTNPEWRKLEDGGLLLKYNLMDLLDNVMIYWVTGSITTSMRLYSETFNMKQYSLNLDSVAITTPSACARFPYELAYQPGYIIKMKFKNLVRLSDLERGGHFAAFEEPKIFADDVWTSFKMIEKFNQL